MFGRYKKRIKPNLTTSDIRLIKKALSKKGYYVVKKKPRRKKFLGLF